MSEEKKIAAPMSMCGCGTNHEAIAAAMKMARQNMRPESVGGDCAQWHYSVAVAYGARAAQLLKAHMYENAKKEGYNISDPVFIRKATAVLSDKQDEMDRKMLAGFFKMDDLNKDVAKFVCEEMEGGDALRPILEAGPTEQVMNQLGFSVREMSISPGHAPSLDDIMKFLSEGNEGSKAN